jgi:hypothetical protein
VSFAAARPVVGHRLPPLPPGAKVHWLGTKGDNRAYPVMGQAKTGENLPAEAEWWCVEGGSEWVRVMPDEGE